MDYEGLRVRTLTTLANGLGSIPAGVTGIVTHYSRGLDIKTDKCECCGLSMSISRVSEEQVELIDSEYTRSMLSWNEQRVYENTKWGRQLRRPDIPKPVFKTFTKLADSE